MSIQLSEDRLAFVRSLVEEGQYPSEQDVFEEALRLLGDHREEQAQLAELRREIAIGIEELNRGESAPFDPRATLAQIRAERAGQGKP